MAHMTARSGDYRYVHREKYLAMPFSVSMAGFDFCAPDYKVIREKSPLSVVGLTLNGFGLITQNDKTVKAEKGSLFIVSAKDSHEYCTGKNWDFCWVNIEGEFFREMLIKYELKDELIFSDFENGEEFKNLIENITKENTDLDVWQIAIQSFLYKTILNLYRKKHFNSINTLPYIIKAELEKHLNSCRTQEEICRGIGITVRHAQRVFKNEFSISIHQFTANEKIKHAKALLINTGSSIKQIALALGFENEKYFSVFFRKREGMSPRDFRKFH